MRSVPYTCCFFVHCGVCHALCVTKPHESHEYMSCRVGNTEVQYGTNPYLKRVMIGLMYNTILGYFALVWFRPSVKSLITGAQVHTICRVWGCHVRPLSISVLSILSIFFPTPVAMSALSAPLCFQFLTFCFPAPAMMSANSDLCALIS